MRIRHLVAVLVLGAAGMVVAHGTAAVAAPACSVVYTVNQWSTGFTTDVRVTNGGAAVSAWTLGWSFAGNQQVTNAWNATVSQSGAAVTATSLGWNGSLGTGASAGFGFQATYSGTNAVPASFTFDGMSCSGDAPPTTAATTAPTTAPTTGPTTPPTTPPASSPAPPAGCTAAASCDGFESQTGTTPTGNWAVTYPDCSGAGIASIDHATAHTGAASLRIDGAAGYCNHVFVRDSQIAGTPYIRFWIKHTAALPAQHVTAVAMQDANDGNNYLRFGGQNGALQFNRASDDATLPEQSPAGVALSAPLPTGTWNCVEFKISDADGTIQTWLNGTAVAGLTEDGIPTHDIDSQWLDRTWRPALTDLRLGWESYGEGADTLWYDDVAARTQRIGC